MPKVTIGMPSFNRGHILGETINYVLNQTFKDFELIIHDDGSKDDSVEIIRSFNDKRIILFTQENQGPPFPLNNIINNARGDYIIILHDHDISSPYLIERSVKALDTYPSAGFVLQGSAWIGEDGLCNYVEMLHGLPEYNMGNEFGTKMILSGSFSSKFHACCMVRRSAFELVGMYYNCKYGLYADVDLWLRLLHKFDFVYINEVLLKFREREKNGKHFLSSKETEILKNQFEIFYDNAQLYFKGESFKINMAFQIIKNNYEYCYERLLQSYFINRHFSLFKTHYKNKKQEIHYRILTRLLFYISNNKTILALVSPYLFWVKQFRKNH